MNETNREIARRLSRFSSLAFHDNAGAVRAQLTDAIEAALNAERERCAKIADKEADDWVVASRNYKALDPMKNTCLSRSEMAIEIAATIRGKQ